MYYENLTLLTLTSWSNVTTNFRSPTDIPLPKGSNDPGTMRGGEAVR